MLFKRQFFTSKEFVIFFCLYPSSGDVHECNSVSINVPAQMERNDKGSSEVRAATSAGVPETPDPEERRGPQAFKVYKRRWFVLLVLCLSNCCNAMVS